MSSFVAAFTILVREGLEAILIVIAMITFLIKAERRDVLPYVHGGWIVALAGGAATWVAATWMINISGASRELTEGFGSLFAALVLLWVGIWMHGKEQRGILAALHPREAYPCTEPALGLVPVPARLRRRLSRSVRDDPVLRRDLESGNGAWVLAGAGAAVAVTGGRGHSDDAVQQAASDRKILCL